MIFNVCHKHARILLYSVFFSAAVDCESFRGLKDVEFACSRTSPPYSAVTILPVSVYSPIHHLERRRLSERTPRVPRRVSQSVWRHAPTANRLSEYFVNTDDKRHCCRRHKKTFPDREDTPSAAAAAAAVEATRSAICVGQEIDVCRRQSRCRHRQWSYLWSAVRLDTDGQTDGRTTVEAYRLPVSIRLEENLKESRLICNDF